MHQYVLLIEKYLVTQSGYFRLSNTVALGMGNKDGKLLFYHVISEESTDKKILTKEYNHSTVYDWFNNPFPNHCGSPVLNPPPVPIYDRPHPHKRARYTLDPFPDTISVASENYVSNLTTPYGSPHLPLLPSYGPNQWHSIKKDDPYRGRVKRGNCSSKCDKKICYKNTRFYFSTCSDKDKKKLLLSWVSRINSEMNNSFM